MDPGSSLRYGRDDDFIRQSDFFSTLLMRRDHKFIGPNAEPGRSLQPPMAGRR
jgi:hypothetical protein